MVQAVSAWGPSLATILGQRQPRNLRYLLQAARDHRVGVSRQTQFAWAPGCVIKQAVPWIKISRRNALKKARVWLWYSNVPLCGDCGLKQIITAISSILLARCVSGRRGLPSPRALEQKELNKQNKSTRCTDYCSLYVFTRRIIVITCSGYWFSSLAMW